MSDVLTDLSEVATLVFVLAGPWLHVLLGRRLPPWLEVLCLVLPVVGLTWWVPLYGITSADCWLQLVSDGADRCTDPTELVWLPLAGLMILNVVLGTRHRLAGGGTPGGGGPRS